MPLIEVTIDDRGGVQVSGDAAATLLGLLLTDDIGDDLEECDRVLSSVAEIRGGRSLRFDCAWNATRLVVEPSGARLTWAMNVSVQVPQELSLDGLTEALLSLKGAIA